MTSPDRPEPTLLGKRVRALRKARGMTQVDLAADLEIKQGSLSDIETGVTKEISGKVLAALCRVLGASPDFFMSEDDVDTDWGELELARQEASFLLGQMPAPTREAAIKAIRGMAAQGAAKPFGDRRPPAQAGQTEVRPKADDRSFLERYKPAHGRAAAKKKQAKRG